MEVTIKDLKKVVEIQFAQMSGRPMFRVDVTKDELRNTYLDSFPEGTNLLYKERREYDCQCCLQFIKAVGGVVVLNNDLEYISIWDVEIGGKYQPVVDALATLVRRKEISNTFLHFEKNAGVDYNMALLEDGTPKRWDHLHLVIPNDNVMTGSSIPSAHSETKSNYDVLKRSLEELSLDSAEIVLELIESKSIYRGEEHKYTVDAFVKYKKQYTALDNHQKDNFVWDLSLKLKGGSKIRNTVIGTLLTDLSEGKELDKAVASFESKVAPENYKRTTALITESMKKKFLKTIQDKGLEPSLSRRYAVAEDLTINNVLYANRTARKQMSALEEAMSSMGTKSPNFNKIEEMSVETFMESIVPNAETVQMFVENKHANNFMSLISPENPEAPNLFKWDNNFSWSYHGEVTDSLRDRVQNLGGRVDGVLRFSHTWNYDGKNQSLMDLHVFFPNSENEVRMKNGKEVHDNYPHGRRVGWNKRTDPQSGAKQDVDFVDPPGDKVPVENITFPDINRMPEGEYVFKIHNWAFRNTTKSGFKAEIEFGGNTYEYNYNQPLSNKEWVTLAKVTLKGGEFTIEHLLENKPISNNVWGVNTESFHDVKMIMNSPNHWDGEETGNKHMFFILDGCNNPDKARGFYNEFLKNELNSDRKAFEALASKMKTPESDNQLSGIGFSSTVRNEAIFKVTGKVNRTVKVKF